MSCSRCNDTCPHCGEQAATTEEAMALRAEGLLAKGWSYNRIARRFRMSSGTVRSWCLKHGLKSKHKPIVRRRKKSA